MPLSLTIDIEAEEVDVDAIEAAVKHALHILGYTDFTISHIEDNVVSIIVARGC